MTAVLTVIGARPQFVKAAVVSRALASTGIDESILHTGQHYDEAMSGIFFDELAIPRPAHQLGVGSGAHGEQTAAMLVGIERVILAERPDWVLLYGDTNSTLAGALAASKHHVPIAHVEAGLRSFNRRMPEEVNRVLTDHVSTLLLCPTRLAVENLEREGIVNTSARHGFEVAVEQVGDVMYDATLLFSQVARQHSTIAPKLGVSQGAFALATIHRAENTDDQDRLLVIVEALCRIGASMEVIWPIHPRTRKLLTGTSVWPQLQRARVRAVDPIGYLDMLQLESMATCIVTDSGGVQKEAYFAGVPCVTLRDETEWVELVESGWNTLVPPTSVDSIVSAVLGARTGAAGLQLYGDGTAAQKVASLLQPKA